MTGLYQAQTDSKNRKPMVIECFNDALPPLYRISMSILKNDVFVWAGFVKGLGQGLVGAAAQPVSGALDFMSSAFEGIDASSNVILGKLSNQRAVKRRRLPRAIGGDRKLQPFLRLDGTDTQAR